MAVNFRKRRLIYLRIWILSAIHWIFGTILVWVGTLELLKIDSPEISGLYIWLKLFIGVSIIILGILFVNNTFKLSKNYCSVN